MLILADKSINNNEINKMLILSLKYNTSFNAFIFILPRTIPIITTPIRPLSCANKSDKTKTHKTEAKDTTLTKYLGIQFCFKAAAKA